jgi:hypothetical protein
MKKYNKHQFDSLNHINKDFIQFIKTGKWY